MVDPMDIDKAASRIATQYGVRGADSVHIAVASTLEISVVTFGFDQRDQASKLVDIIEIPAE